MNIPVLRLEQMQLDRLLVVGVDEHGIATGEAGVAEAGRPRLAVAYERVEALLVQIAEAVRADERADLLDRVRGCDQLLVRRRVDAVEARTGGRRRADAHVHLASAGAAHHGDDLPAGRAAYDRIVHDDHALALEHFAL